MFWRDDPRPDPVAQLGRRPDWPRNGALLRGVVHTVEGAREGPQYLEVTEYCQAGDTKFVETPGCWMCFDQGGRLLHAVKDTDKGDHK